MSNLYNLDSAKEAAAATQLPKPTGFRLLIAIPEVAERTEGNIIRPDELRAREQTAAVIGFVLAVGPDAYKDTTRFPNGAWCKAGDFVVLRSYAGTRIKIHGKEFRLVNDDTVDAVVDDPRGYERA